MPKQLSLKQKKFADEYIVNGGNATKAALSSYNVKDAIVAKAQGWAALHSSQVQSYLVQKLDKMNLLKEEFLYTTLEEIITTGKTRKVTAAEALKAIDIALKLRDLYPAEKTDITTRSLTLELRGKSIQELKEEYAKLDEEAGRYLK